MVKVMNSFGNDGVLRQWKYCYVDASMKLLINLYYVQKASSMKTKVLRITNLGKCVWRSGAPRLFSLPTMQDIKPFH